MIRGGRDNCLVDEFIDAGAIGVGYAAVPEASDLSRDDIEALLRAEGTSATVGWHSEMLVDFVHRVDVGDVVIMPDTPNGEVVIGEIAGGYEFHPELPPERYRHRRPVVWMGRQEHAELPASRQGLYRQRPTLLEVEDADDLVAHAQRVRSGEVGRPATPPARPRRRPGSPHASTVGRSPSGEANERVCEKCFQRLKVSAFVHPDDGFCKTCEDV